MTEASSRRRVLFLAVAFASATVALFSVSRGKWSDALVDAGNVWIVPYSLARGELLYRDSVYWFGPFTPYFHAAFFEILGSTFRTLAVAGVLGSIATVAALFVALRRVASRTAAVLACGLAVPALVFMPSSGGSILGMGYRIWHAATFALLAIAVLAGAGVRSGRRRAFFAGALAGLAGLCRTEWGLVTLGAAVLVLLARDPERSGSGARALRLLAGFLVVFGGTYVAFGSLAGWRAILSDAPVLLVNLPEETRAHVALAGASAWRDGVWTLLYSAASWLSLYLLVELAALRRADSARARRRLPALAALLAILAISAWRGGALTSGLVWSAAPLICAIAAVVALRGERTESSAALFGFGLLGLLLSHRRPFFIGDGPYAGPPLLFAFVCAAGLLSVSIAREREPAVRRRLAAGVATVAALLIAVAFAVRATGYLRDDRVAIRGTDGFLSASPGLAREVEDLAADVRSASSEGDGLVVFPEGEVLNYLSGRRNPIRHKLYLPGYVNSENEAEIVAELERAAPASVVVWNRPLGEYGAGTFGLDYARRIRAWIDRDYEVRPRRSPGPSLFEHYVRRASAP